MQAAHREASQVTPSGRGLALTMSAIASRPPGRSAAAAAAKRGDRPYVLGVGDDHASDVGLEDPGDLHRRAGRLHRNLIVSAEALSEELELGPVAANATGRACLSPLKDRHLAKALVDIESN